MPTLSMGNAEVFAPMRAALLGATGAGDIVALLKALPYNKDKK